MITIADNFISKEYTTYTNVDFKLSVKNRFVYLGTVSTQTCKHDNHCNVTLIITKTRNTITTAD